MEYDIVNVYMKKLFLLAPLLILLSGCVTTVGVYEPPVIFGPPIYTEPVIVVPCYPFYPHYHYYHHYHHDFHRR